ncbi:MAG: hypothetical protein M1817_000817 [Caeruleum heppii]|nr:MAG: hypothetical protein M1817_000817 [Caeruleum heppii]
MVIDLGLHREPSRLISRTGGIDLPHGKGKEDHASTPKGRFWSREERRALLGCYYLSSTTSMSFNKPNNMRYSEYMISTAQSLADEEELTTDVALPSLIQLQHIAEEVSEMLRADDPAKVFAVSGDLRLRIYMKQFELQLQKCRQASLATKTTFPILELAHHFVNIYLFEIGLYLEPPPLEERVNEGYHSSSPSEPATNPSAAPTPRSTLSAAPPNTSTRTPNDPSFAATRLDILLHCFEATKAYLDHFLTLPLTHFRRYTVIDWIRLTYAIIVLSKLSRPIPSLPHWNVQSVRDAAKLELYLESLCYRMQSITTCISATTPDGAPSEPDVFLAFKISFERMRNWFQARMAQPGGRSLGGSTTSNPPGPSGDEGSPLEVLREVHGGTEGGFGKTPPALRNSDDHHNARWPQEVNEGHANPLADPSSAADGTATDFGGVGAGGFTGLLAPDDDFWRALTDWTHLPEFGEMEF